MKVYRDLSPLKTKDTETKLKDSSYNPKRDQKIKRKT